ncbi:hypothetical protein F511_35228 [Dorcoceras hygrometricum]|uniref:Uncharacterized protein n=1 Tax=Dorcoceras hygrometricum TaxID=472368 RepID=A0A2Z7ASA8_9LAMI|nr:hypothetical protein F511_35228 [Dorcoceras hygrometricum]
MVIGSLATLDSPIVVDLIGIFVLKGPYCTLTMTDWFLQALSVIPRGSWGDVARRFTMIRWASSKMWFRSHTCCEPTASWGQTAILDSVVRKNCFRIIKLSFLNSVDRSDLIVDRDYDGATVMDLKRMFNLGLGPPQAHWAGSSPSHVYIYIVPRVTKNTLYNTKTLVAASLPSLPLTAAAPLLRRRPPPAAAAIRICRRQTCSDCLDEEILSVKHSSRFLVQTDERIVISVVDRIRITTTANH